MKDQLAYWLFDGATDYQKGVEIFKQLKIDTTAHNFYDVQKPDQMRINMLRNALRNYARIHNIQPRKYEKLVHVPPSEVQKSILRVSKTAVTRPVIHKNPHIDYDRLNDEMKALYDKNGELARQLKSFHVAIKALGPDDKENERRRELADNILTTDNQIRANWQVIDTWYATGETVQIVPETKKADDMSDLEKDRRIKANLNYIRRYHADPKKADEVQIRKTELTNWQVDYEKVIQRSSQPE
jgi:hypothetical protein